MRPCGFAGHATNMNGCSKRVFLALLVAGATLRCAGAHAQQGYEFGIRFQDIRFRPQNFSGFSFRGQTFRAPRRTPIQFERINFPAFSSRAVRRNVRAVDTIDGGRTATAARLVGMARHGERSAASNIISPFVSTPAEKPVSEWPRTARRLPNAGRERVRQRISSQSTRSPVAVQNAYSRRHGYDVSRTALANTRRPFEFPSRAEIRIAGNRGRVELLSERDASRAERFVERGHSPVAGRNARPQKATARAGRISRRRSAGRLWADAFVENVRR